MNRAIQTKILIHSPVDTVWEALMDYRYYPEWSPTIQPVANFPAVGHRLKIKLRQPNGFSITMNPQILVKDEPTELRWRGRLFFQGLFDGEHYFILREVDAYTTEFIQGENFSGLLVPFMHRMIDKDTLSGFDLFNQALKKRVERS